MCDSRQPSDGADSGWGHTDVESKTILINPMWHPDLHVCTKEDCGHECHWEGGVPLYSFHISASDSSGMDVEDQPCPCEEHMR